MALGVEMLVERMLAGARRVAGDDGDSALCSYGLSEVIGVIGGIGHDDLGGQTIDQRCGLRHIAAMTGSQCAPDWATKAANREMDLGAQTAAGTANGLIFRPPFLAPAAC